MEKLIKSVKQIFFVVCLLVAQTSDAFSAALNPCPMMDEMEMVMVEHGACASSMHSVVTNDLAEVESVCCDTDCACSNVFVSFSFMTNGHQNSFLTVFNDPVMSTNATFSDVVLMPLKQPPIQFIS